MCGIITIIGLNSKAIAKAALAKIKHRGLDAHKLLKIPNTNITIGFNRLAINDKSAKGVQPFEYGDLVGVFNGEIYNAKKLKKQYDITTNSQSDIEIILPLFEQLGTAIINHLDGFYAGLIINKNTQEIYTLKDYIGKKSLFYGATATHQFITSELKAIPKLLHFTPIPKGIAKLQNKQVKTLRQHQIKNADKGDLQIYLLEAVKKRIPNNEAQFGVFLSGGLDSAIITYIVTQCASNVTYYTLGNKNAKDVNHVKILSKALNIEQQVKYIPLPALNELPKLTKQLVYHTESYNPSIISNGMATYLLAQAARQDGIKVILSGEGADELFCGYPMGKGNEIAKRIAKRKELIQYMYLTELRRLDLASMANTIEVRCPFLDRKVFAAAMNCNAKDLFLLKDKEVQGKMILRNLFAQHLPPIITNRKKMSFDVGSGIRKLLVPYLSQSGKTEKEALLQIWKSFFPKQLLQQSYFHAYPTFDKAIEKRGTTHR